jgi:hypothetical protein
MRCQDDVVRIRPSPSVHADRHLSACKADHFGKTVPQGRQAVNHGIWRDISRRKTLENTTFSYRMLPNPGFQFPPPPPKCLILLTFWRRTVFASTSIGLFLTRAACATPRTKARVVNPLPSILEHTFLDLNPPAAWCRRVARRMSRTIFSASSECCSAAALIAPLARLR